MGLILPIELPTDLTQDQVKGIVLPITLPMSLLRDIGERVTIKVQYNETVNLDEYHGSVKIPYKESASGQIQKFLYKEKAWFFPGLILEERVIEEMSSQITLNENVQALILVDFELLSSNELKFTWYGNSVPSFTVMKKSSADEKYIEDNSYTWNAPYGTVTIGSDSYNIYLLGSSNSGSSDIYTIGATDVDLVIPEVQVSLNEQIYDIDIDYESIFTVDINYY